MRNRWLVPRARRNGAACVRGARTRYRPKAGPQASIADVADAASVLGPDMPGEQSRFRDAGRALLRLHADFCVHVPAAGYGPCGRGITQPRSNEISQSPLGPASWARHTRQNFDRWPYVLGVSAFHAAASRKVRCWRGRCDPALVGSGVRPAPHHASLVSSLCRCQGAPQPAAARGKHSIRFVQEYPDGKLLWRPEARASQGALKFGGNILGGPRYPLCIVSGPQPAQLPADVDGVRLLT